MHIQRYPITHSMAFMKAKKARMTNNGHAGFLCFHKQPMDFSALSPVYSIPIPRKLYVSSPNPVSLPHRNEHGLFLRME